MVELVVVELVMDEKVHSLKYLLQLCSILEINLDSCLQLSDAGT